MSRPAAPRSEELPLDNAARLVLFDAIALGPRRCDEAAVGLSDEALFNATIGRLRLLVPRELHMLGEHEYVTSKIAACLDAGVLQRHPTRPELVLGGAVPRVRYPDGSIRDYLAGLEAARERLEADEGKLRRVRFDVHSLIGSLADDPNSDAFQRLVASMREHGYLDQFPVAVSASGVVVDGRARIDAAAEANVPLKRHHRIDIPTRRDTLLHHALLTLDANAARLSEADRARVHDAIATSVERDWIEIEDDLALTREWRRIGPKKYDAKLDVKLIPFAQQRDAKVQVTSDGTRIMLRSVMQQAGVASYNRDHLKPYVAMEEARTKHSGKRAIFVNIADAITGIEAMQRDRAYKRLKVDKAWDDIRQWLVDTFATDTPGSDAVPPVPDIEIGPVPS